MTDIVIISLCSLSLLLCIVLLFRLIRQNSALKQLSEQNKSLSSSVGDMQCSLTELSIRSDAAFSALSAAEGRQLQSIDNMRSAMEANLERIRYSVDEKLQESLSASVNRSFRQVSLQLEQVFKGLGEMQSIASGVGDLKKVLSNVKTRGILGELQLGAILSQLLSPEQYEENVTVEPHGRYQVEFAIKLPGEGGTVWLPVDAKFHSDAFSGLTDAYEEGDRLKIEQARALLCSRVKSSAKDIRDKYIRPPYTTDFAVLFVPVEGMYAELVRGGLLEELQRDYRVTIAGPTTMGVLLNSLQMGFRSLAVQKRSTEVWQVLAQAKEEFTKFGTVLAQAQTRISQAGDELDKLVGVRTRQIQRVLKDVQQISSPEDQKNVIDQ